MLEVACREAQDILLDQRLFLLNDNQFEAFIEELDAPHRSAVRESIT